MTVVDKLKDIEVLTPEEDRVRLGSFWQDRPVILVFIRHFG